MTLFNQRLKMRHPDGRSEFRTIETAEEFAPVLRDGFGIDMGQEDLRHIVGVMEEQGTGGAPHPFFA